MVNLGPIINAMKNKVKSESQEQQNFVMKLRWLWPDLEFFAIPNGGKRNPGEARILKLEGVEAGTPDIFIAEPVGKFHGMFIELKRSSDQTSKVSKEQSEKIEKLLARGYHAAICYGAADALSQLKFYLGKK